jgi:Tol biopolymer transport system component
VGLQPGTRLGPYEIFAPLGAGGMGEVYKARDTRLGRTVALKILPPEFSEQPDRRARFAREAKSISQLNHPHICTLYDVGEAELASAHPSTGSGWPDLVEGQRPTPSARNVSYLVMEHLEGQTLAKRLAKGRLPLDEALRIGAEIADALAAAHRHGVIHRDLKPSNVMLARNGGPTGPPTVKLLDFGLAKVRDQAIVSAGPTETESLTNDGILVGTLPYMAPEQVEGKPADARTDIWALGCVLYEMVTGRRAFAGDSQASLITAIMSHEPPPLAETQPLTSPALEHIVRKCLARSPDDRWDGAHDVADELRWVSEAGSLPAPEATATAHRRRWRVVGAAAVVVAFSMVAGAMLTWKFQAGPDRAVRHVLLDTRPAKGLSDRPPGVTWNGDSTVPPTVNRPSRTALALSPDGTSLVFSAVQGERQLLYRRRLTEGVAEPLEGTEGAQSPFFSPDGTWIGFWARGALRKMRLDGGAPIELCPTGPFAGASWSSKDTIAFSAGHGAYGISLIPAAGGVPKAISTLDVAGGEVRHVLPHFLPDGNTILFTIQRDVLDFTRASISALSLVNGSRTALVDGAMDARYIPTGHLVYVRHGQLEAVPFDDVQVAVTGEAVGLIPDVMQAWNSESRDETGAAQFTVSDTGTLAYVAGGVAPDVNTDFVWVDRRGTVVETLPVPRGPNRAPRLSPDGTRLLYARVEPEWSLWCYDFARQTSTVIPTTETQPHHPIWFPDCRRVVFGSAPGGATRLYVVQVDGSSPPSPVGGDVPALAAEYPGSLSPDGHTLVFTRESEEGGRALWGLRMGQTSPQRSVLLEPPGTARDGPGIAPGSVTCPAVSPDGRWLAYVSDESGRNEVYVRRFPGLGSRQQLSREGGRAPVWRRDGRELFYLADSPTRRMMVVDLHAGSTLDPGTPRVLFVLADELRTLTQVVPAYDVAVDGQRFLFVRQVREPVPPPPSEIHVVFNWTEELKAKAGRR